MKPKKKQKLKLRLWVVVLFLCISFTGVVYYSNKVITWKLHTEENKKIKEELDTKVKKITPSKEETRYEIDFNSLKEKNEDTVAYIEVKNTNISYVVVRGYDNSYYLNHNFEKEWNVAGWIFGDYHNKFDETDKNLVIYGHETKDGSMFGTLNKVIAEEWYKNKENYEISLVTEQGNYTYQVFSVYSIDPEDYYINTYFQGNEFEDFINTIHNRSIYDFSIDVTSKDKILTLSSCLYEGRQRVVLHAKLKEKRENIDEN